MFRALLLVPIAIFLSGCASHIGAFFNRPVVQDKVEGVATTFALAADRRTVVVSLVDGKKGMLCAEPPPDTATGITTDLKANFDNQKIKLGLNDQLITTVTVLADRTANLDAFRTGVYALCQFHLNGAIKDADVGPAFNRLITSFETVQKADSAARAASSAR